MNRWVVGDEERMGTPPGSSFIEGPRLLATPWPLLPAWGAGLSAGTGPACSVAQVGSPPARDACYWPMGYCLRRLGYCVLAWSDLEHARPPPLPFGERVRWYCNWQVLFNPGVGIPCCRMNPPWQEFLTSRVKPSSCQYLYLFLEGGKRT